MDESSETMICAKCGLPITDELFVAVEERMGGINGLSGSTCTTALILIRFASGLIIPSDF